VPAPNFQDCKAPKCLDLETKGSESTQGVRLKTPAAIARCTGFNKNCCERKYGSFIWYSAVSVIEKQEIFQDSSLHLLEKNMDPSFDMVLLLLAQ